MEGTAMEETMSAHHEAARALRIGSVVVNVSDIRVAMAFWSEALGYRPRYEPEPDWVILEPRDGRGPNLSLNLGETRPAEFPHVHLDLYADDQQAEVDRLLGLGARRVEDWPYPDDEDEDYVVLEDPDGNRFCVIDASPDAGDAEGGEGGDDPADDREDR
ncbi:VOC family protein [Phycicoccus sp. SLBN-51]|uniref:VOC family protein n=1 Tax=Phycicoccus sp. SLBN-51 TaxID=2768447 RepID=UPI00336A3086